MIKNESILGGAAIPPNQDQVNLSRRILVADDDLHIRELIALTLMRSGYQVDIAKDGADAWEALNEASYYLLITDYNMPRVTGVELIKKLRSENMTLPVILVSGTMPTEELKRHPWLRVDATLPKPFTVAELLDLVEKVLPPAAGTASNSRLFREYALRDTKTSQAEEPAIASTRDQMNFNSSRRILVVDDDSDVRQLSIDVLAGSGYDVEGVKDGAAGWEALQTCDYDLVITDNQMPRLTGIEMIEKLRSARIAIPVIMATGNLPVHEFARRPWLKPDATLQRPFTNDDLLETVRNVFGTDNGNDGCNETLLPKYL